MDNKPVPILAFLVGMLVGSAVALLYAPQSGEELRDELRRERAKAQDEFDRTTAELRDTLAETRGQLAAYAEQARSRAEKRVEEIEETA